MNKDAFSTYNPGINFTFFIGAVVFGMFFVHPAFLLCSAILAMAYYVTVRGAKAWKLIAGMIPVFVVVSIINPLLNTYGERILFTYFGGRPYTLEALLYGTAIGGMFVTIILWFASYSVVMTSDKFTYIFGRVAPSITLVLTMVLRLIPRFKQKAVQISTARKSIGKGTSGEKTGDKISDGMTVLSCLTTWALEGGIITADSMRSRGYGSGKRTNFSIYRFAARDKALLLVMGLLILLLIICGIKGGMEATFTPAIDITGTENPFFIIGIIAYFVLLAIPTALNIVEEITWHILRSKI